MAFYLLPLAESLLHHFSTDVVMISLPHEMNYGFTGILCETNQWPRISTYTILSIYILF